MVSELHCQLPNDYLAAAGWTLLTDVGFVLLIACAKPAAHVLVACQWHARHEVRACFGTLTVSSARQTPNRD
jgi:hypothetical protein